MNKQILTTLGCSGSIALTLFNTQAASASTDREYTFTAPATNQELLESSEFAEIPQS